MWLCYLSHKEAKKKPIVKMGLNPYISHLPSISTLPYGRLLCSRRACPSYTLYGKYIVANGNDNVWSFHKFKRYIQKQENIIEAVDISLGEVLLCKGKIAQTRKGFSDDIHGFLFEEREVLIVGLIRRLYLPKNLL